MKKALLSVTLLATTMSVAAEETTNNLMNGINDAGFGNFSGQIQSLTMSRDKNKYATGDERGDTSTLAFTLNYLSPEYAGFTVGAQWVSSFTLWEHNPNVPINDDFNTLNKAFVNLNMSAYDLAKSNVKMGRFAIDTLLMPDIAPRQKSQSMEGIVFESEDIKDTKLVAGWIYKYSSWSTFTYEDSAAFNYEFTDVSDVAGKDYSTAGTFFVDYTYTGINKLNINVSDYLSEDIFNTVLADVKWEVVEGIKWRNVWAHQDSVGKGNGSYGNDGDLSADFIETSVIFEGKDGAYIRPGIWLVPGSAGGDNEHTFQDLFQSNLTPTFPLMANPYGFLAGTTGYFVEGYSALSKKDWLWAMAAFTDVDNSADTDDYDAVELNVIYGRQLAKNFSTSVKLGYAWLDDKIGSDDTQAWDARLFLTYQF